MEKPVFTDYRIDPDADETVVKLWKVYWLWLAGQGRDFEIAVGEVFKQVGYEVEVTPAANDGGKDLILRRGDETAIVECKAHNNPVQVDVIRSLLGVLQFGSASQRQAGGSYKG